jgi:hypothetical protein
MDTTALAFYAAICGILSMAAPALGSPYIRLGVGAAVGIVAAAALPLIQQAFGLGY